MQITFLFIDKKKIVLPWQRSVGVCCFWLLIFFSVSFLFMIFYLCYGHIFELTVTILLAWGANICDWIDDKCKLLEMYIFTYWALCNCHVQTYNYSQNSFEKTNQTGKNIVHKCLQFDCQFFFLVACSLCHRYTNIFTFRM